MVERVGGRVGASGEAVERVRRELSVPGRTPERDCFLAVAKGGSSLVGCALTTIEPYLSRLVLTLAVLDGAERQGIERDLTQKVIEHARLLGLAFVQSDVHEGDAAVRTMFTSLRFDHVRNHLHLRRDGDSIADVPLRDGVSLRTLTPDDVSALTELQNAAFTGSWGYSPNVPEEIRYRVFDLPMHGPDDVTLLLNRGELAAYCWAHVEGPRGPGFIGMVGTHPSQQGKGLGRIVTASGLNRLVQRGFERVDITVDAENTPAVRLYESLGFELEWRSLWYELRLTG